MTEEDVRGGGREIFSCGFLVGMILHAHSYSAGRKKVERTDNATPVSDLEQNIDLGAFLATFTPALPSSCMMRHERCETGMQRRGRAENVLSGSTGHRNEGNFRTFPLPRNRLTVLRLLCESDVNHSSSHRKTGEQAGKSIKNMTAGVNIPDSAVGFRAGIGNKFL